MRRLIVPVTLLLLIGAAACGGGGTPGGPDSGGGAAAEAGAGAGGGLGSDTVPPCPFTAAQVTEFVGQPMKDDGNCSFGDGKGVAVLGITMASEVAGLTTYDYQRKQADQIYREVKDIDKGGKGYLAVKDIGAEAVLISGKGSYTVTLSSFERLGDTPGGYEQVLRKMLDALPA
jgi:hypothetical protein